MPKEIVREGVELKVGDVMNRTHTIASLLADNAIPAEPITMLSLIHIVVSFNLTLTDDPKIVIENILNMVNLSGELAGWDNISKSRTNYFKTKAVM